MNPGTDRHGHGRVLIPASNRKTKRERKRDAEKERRKSTARYQRKLASEQQLRDDFVQKAKVYLEGAGSPAMQLNVGREVGRMALELAERDDVSVNEALNQIKQKMQAALTATRKGIPWTE